MAQQNQQFYILNVKVRENLTDTRALERLIAWDFTMEEWNEFEKKISPFFNLAAERIVRFFVEYGKMDICPDLFGSWEPIKEVFNKEDICEPSSRLSYPAATLFLKKKRRFEVIIENLNYGLIFDPQNKYKVIPSKRKKGEYLGNIRILIRKDTAKFTLEQMQTIVDDMCEYLGTDYGCITHWDNYARKDIEILYQHSQK